ncbi:MAG TPA: AAA family ATPase, partial [Catalimonadaceae bacterium]|nr:AAA family ATPase [Catalimonadaceae bacterium]
MLNRHITSQIKERFGKGKVILLHGPRQVGKTTLVKAIAANHKTLWLNGDESDVKLLFENPTSTRLKNLVGDAELLVIDEAQSIPNIGLVLKLMVDNLSGIQIVATGS